ncbi:hypothetical protein [Fulvivirga kasyanovii]|uniref:hypothetical protein n=1 Tax=Fulvivirga kasyanovii TaxID=396812 RepID=UPI0012BB559E|nr:hypothetical protein [Fulvivirga kasyanovii]
MSLVEDSAHSRQKFIILKYSQNKSEVLHKYVQDTLRPLATSLQGGVSAQFINY